MLDKQDGAYLSDLMRRTDGVRNAIVKAVGADARYQVKYRHSGGLIWATAAQDVTYRVGQEVLVRADHAGAAAGTTPKIIGVAQSSANGMIVVERTETTTRTAETLTGYPAGPRRLVAGGLPDRIVLSGYGLATAPTYGHASIVNDVAAVINGASIVISPKAQAGCPKGRYSLVVAGQTIPGYFEVV
jgi:hypothetical protein